jgi:hypothetical protein
LNRDAHVWTTVLSQSEARFLAQSLTISIDAVAPGWSPIRIVIAQATAVIGV